MSQAEFDRGKELIAKFKREHEHFIYLKKKGYTSLEIASKLTHEMLETLKDEVQMCYPNADAEEIRIRMIQVVLRDESRKKKARFKRHGKK
ncbi:MAG: hypothetical protein ACTSVZ_02045 [Promethearchaeota archaeon]